MGFWDNLKKGTPQSTAPQPLRPYIPTDLPGASSNSTPQALGQSDLGKLFEGVTPRNFVESIPEGAAKVATGARKFFFPKKSEVLADLEAEAGQSLARTPELAQEIDKRLVGITPTQPGKLGATFDDYLNAPAIDPMGIGGAMKKVGKAPKKLVELAKTFLREQPEYGVIQELGTFRAVVDGFDLPEKYGTDVNLFKRDVREQLDKRGIPAFDMSDQQIANLADAIEVEGIKIPKGRDGVGRFALSENTKTTTAINPSKLPDAAKVEIEKVRLSNVRLADEIQRAFNVATKEDLADYLVNIPDGLDNATVGKLSKTDLIESFVESASVQNILDVPQIKKRLADALPTQKSPEVFAGAAVGIEDTDGDGMPDNVDPLKAAAGIAGMGSIKKVMPKLAKNPRTDEAASQVETEMLEFAQPGYRLGMEDGTTRAVSSSFPKWVPEELRSSELFQKVWQKIDAGEVPTSSRQKALFDVIEKEITRRVEKDSQLPDELLQAYENDPALMAREGRREEARSILVGKAERRIPSDSQPSRTIEEMSSLIETIPRLSEDLNIERLDISEKARGVLKDAVDDVKPLFEEKTGKKLTNKEVIAEANASSKILEGTVGREKTLEWEAAMLKAREKLARLAETGVVDQEYIDTLLTVKTLGSDIGRKLQSLSIKAQPKEANAIGDILDAILKTTDDTDGVLRAAKDVDFSDYKQAAAFYRQFVKPTAGDWVDLLRYNSMLSSPLTHIVNVFSNLVNSGLIGTLEKATVGTIDAFASTVTGRERKAFAGEAGVFLKNYATAIGEATKRFSDSLTGKLPSTNLDVRNIPLAQSGQAKVVENVLSVPMKFLEASDQFFTALTEAGEKAALDYRASKGVKVRTPVVKAQENAAYRLYRQDLFPDGQGTLLNAVDTLTQKLYEMRNSPNPIISNVFKFTVPFIRTPTNIFKQGLEYSPTGFFTLHGATDKQTQLAKAAVGTAVFGTGAMLLNSGRLTWSEPLSDSERNSFRDAGMQPYSVKVGDTWYSYQKLPPPIAFPFAMVALIDNARKERKMDESVAEMVLSSIAKYGDFLADQSYAKSIGDLLAALQGGESDWARVAGNVPQQLVPFRALGGWLSRLTDDVQRKPDPDGSFIEKQVQLLMMNIPGLSDNVPARETATGDEVKNRNRVQNAFSPIRMTTEDEQKANDFEDMLDVKRLEARASQEHSVLKEQAETTLTDLKAMPKELAAQRFNEIAASNPPLAEKINDLIELDMMDYTPLEKKLKDASVEARAQYLVDTFKGIKDQKEKSAKWQELIDKKIITKSVANRFAELSGIEAK